MKNIIEIIREGGLTEMIKVEIRSSEQSRISLPFLNFIECSSRRRMLPGKRECFASFYV